MNDLSLPSSGTETEDPTSQVPRSPGVRPIGASTMFEAVDEATSQASSAAVLGEIVGLSTLLLRVAQVDSSW